ncbi:LysR family transcriptional regulator [Cupriavidus sp. NPDC089707]|uniref:LysR family transcriptional regulator n=1 Tax=Cupriavidus sp. NPDC089707 TaxID=3363963 RepID=UPI00380A7D3B
MQEADWDDLKHFLAVSQSGSLAGAARTLHVNHSTVLRRLARLEEVLGTLLFERHPTGYALTAAGEALAQRLAGVGEQIDAAQRQLSGLDSQLSGPLRVTTTDTLLTGLLMPLFAEFRAMHPRIQLQIVVNNGFLSLSRREADVAIRPANAPPEYLVGRRIGRLQTAAYASRRYLQRLGLPTEADSPLLSDWTAYDWVVPDEALSHLAQARWVRDQVPEHRRAVSADSLVAMADAVRHGMGAGMLLCFLAGWDAELVRLAPAERDLDTDLWLLTHPDLRHSARVRVLTDFLYERVRAAESVMV